MNTTTRRQALQGLVGGFAVAAMPQLEAAIHTPAEGLNQADVKFKAADGRELRVFMARPSSGGAQPVVLVVSEIFGVHEYIRDVCRRLARAGYAAFAPQLFDRQGQPQDHSDATSIINNIIAKVPDAQVFSDLDQTLTQARALPGIDPRRAYITGFCWGGRITWLYAAKRPQLKAAVAWYGRLSGSANALTPEHPLDVLEQLKVPLLGLYGGQDSGIPMAVVKQTQDTAELHQAPVTWQVYPEAPHAFHADYRPSYRQTEAEDGWKRLLDHFKKY